MAIKTDDRIRLFSIVKEKELWLLVLLGILYFHRPLFLGETFFFRDLSMHFVPQRQLLIDFIKNRELPLWDVYLQGGQPYLEYLTSAVLYPSSLLYLFLPLLRAFNADIVLHVLYILLSAYILSRVLGLLPASSVLVASIYGFCGYTLSIINMPNHFWAISHIPALLLFWHLFLARGNRKWFLITVMIGAIQVFTGSPATNILSMLFLLGWALAYPFSHTSRLQRSLQWVGLGIFTVGIATIQIIPAIEMVLHSLRAQGFGYATFAQWSLHPKQLTELMFPGFFGHIDSIPWNVHYWGWKLVDRGYPYIVSLYMGCVTIVLAILGGISKPDDRLLLPSRVRRFLLLLIGLSFLVSLGRFLPFFHLVYTYIPLIDSFRFPMKSLIIGILPLALLTGYSAEIHFGRIRSDNFSNQSVRSILAVFWGIAAILMIFTGMFSLSSGFARYFQQWFFKQPANDVMYSGLRSSLLHATAIWLSVTLLYQHRRIRKSQWQQWLLVGVFIVDLLSAGKRVNIYAPEEFFTNIPAVVPMIQHEIGEGRLFRDQNPETIRTSPKAWLADPLFQRPADDVIWKARWYFEVLDFYSAVFYKFPIIFHTDVLMLAQKYIMEMKARIHSLPWEQRLPLLSAGGVTVILTPADVSIPGMERIGEVPNWSNVPFYLYRNTAAADRVQFITSWQQVTSDAEALEAMLSPSYDPRKHVILQQSRSTRSTESFTPPTLKAFDPVSSMCRDPFSIKKLASNSHSASFMVSNRCDGYLVFSEPFYSGWEVYVDGELTPVWRANYAFSAIYLQAGQHAVKRVYRPMALILGTLSSAVFCLGLCLMAYTGKGIFSIPDKNR